MDKKKILQFSLILTVVLLTACAGQTSPGVIPPDQLGTAIVETSAALAAQTALYAQPTSLLPTAIILPTDTTIPSPTFTETQANTPFIITVVTRTPTITLTGTPTITKTPTLTKTTTATVSPPCVVVSQLPANNSSFSAGALFDAVWTVVNSSSIAWTVGNVDFLYSGGTKIHTGADIQDLPATVTPNQSQVFIVHMQAPVTLGTYSETWVLSEGGTNRCSMSMTIQVK